MRAGEIAVEQALQPPGVHHGTPRLNRMALDGFNDDDGGGEQGNRERTDRERAQPSRDVIHARKGAR